MEEGLTPQWIESLLLQSRSNNARQSITGVLLFDKFRFLQILEGEPETIYTLYGKIENDPRHKSVELLHEQLITKCSFQVWKMGYFTPATNSLKTPYKDIRGLYIWDEKQIKNDLGNSSVGYRLFVKYMRPPTPN